MNKIIAVVAAMIISLAAGAQGIYTKQCADKTLQKKAQKWMRKGTWRNGFKAAAPHNTVNAAEFYSQYTKNTEQWNALFAWFAGHDLTAIPKGKYTIEGTDITVSVEDSENGDITERKSESHRHTIDLQYVVRGTERFGIIDHQTSTPSSKYRPDVTHYNYDKDKARFYDSSTDSFFIFFPDDWHIAKLKTDLPDQSIRVVVAKVKYID